MPDLIKMTLIYNERLKTIVESVILADVFLVSKTFLKKLNSKFNEKMEQKAIEDLKEPNIVLAFRSERAVIAGTQMPSSKQAKQKGKKAVEQNNENLVEISFITETVFVQDIKSMIEDLPDELVQPLVEDFFK